MINRYIFLVLSVAIFVLSSCIDDSITTSPSAQPAFSTDTLDMGTVFTAEQTATHRFVVYNRNNKGINVADISLSGVNSQLFRLNVDGLSGKQFADVEIRANDSIFVFVCADFPENGLATPQRIDASLDFTVNGRVSSVIVTANGQDVQRLKAMTIDSDTRLEAGKPYQVTDSLVVGPDATLTVAEGVTMLFHDNAKLIVRGSLRCEGSPQYPIKLTGDRTGNVITDVSFDLMSRQWGGIDFMEESHHNYMAYTDVSNTTYGTYVWGDGSDVDSKKLTLVNSRMRNSGDCILTAVGASVEAFGCEFADAANSLVRLVGGDHRFDLCTTANYYLFSAVMGASWYFEDFLAEEDAEAVKPKALITNSISYGRGADASPGDLSGYDVYFLRCLFKSAGTDDDNFKDSIWDADPLYYTVREDYVFDYRLRPDSPAIGVAYSALSQDHPLDVDYYGVPRKLDIGAYVYVEPTEW